MRKSPPNLADLSPAARALLIRRLQEKSGKETHPITRRDARDEYPLSFAQQRLWVLDKMQPDKTLYNISMPIEIRSSSDPGFLQWALREGLGAIVSRHEVLRASFVVEDGIAVQHINPVRPIELPVTDLSELPPDERAAELQRQISAEARRPFDLSRDPLLRARMLQLGQDRYLLILTTHHIAFDAWSVGVLMTEMQAFLVGCDTGRLSSLPDLPLQYADFAAWQRRWLQGPVLERQFDYWRKQLDGAPPVLELPISRPRPAVRASNGARRSFAVAAPVVAALNELSRREGATLFMTLLAAWNVLLHRYTGQDDLVIGSPIANRNRKEIEGLIGFFVNTLALRTNLAGNPSFRELLGRVRQVALDAYAHQDLPFEMLVEALQPERSLSYSPLFQVVFVLQNSAPPVEASSGTSIRLLTDTDGPAQFDLTLSLMELGAELHGVLEYNADLFDAPSIERMLCHFTTVLAGIADDPDQPISRIPLLTAAERREILVEWNRTQAPYPAELPAHALFEAHAERAPDAVALVFDSRPTTNDQRPTTTEQGSGVRGQGLVTAQGNPRATSPIPDPRSLIPGPSHLTYGELNRRANQLAHYLRAHGVGPEVTVGICIERSPEIVIALLGILKAGGAFLPIDPLYPPERLTYMLEDARVPVLLIGEGLGTRDWGLGTREQERDPKPLAPSPTPIAICLDTDWPAIAGQPDTNPSGGAQADNLAYMIYTSGSTGRPKGTLLLHRGLCNFILDYAHTLNVSEGSRVLQFFSFGFDGSLAEIFLTMLTGATLCITRPDTPLTGTHLIRTLEEYAITAQILPPAVLAVLSPGDLPALRSVAAAGERCSGDIVSRWGKGRRFFNVYGATEATIASTMFLAHGDWAAEATIPVGRPMANSQIYILDRHLQPVPPGVIGDIYIGGVGLGRGYLGRPDLTAERFIPNPFASAGDKVTRRQGDKVTGEQERYLNLQSPISNLQSPDESETQNSKLKTQNSDRLYRTGDLGRYRPDGVIEFLDRDDDQVKVRGFRVELGEIEAALRQYPGLRDVAVVATSDGIGSKRLVAYVVQEPGVSGQEPGVGDQERSVDPRSPIPDPRSLIPALEGFLQARLPQHMIPSLFITLDSLPLTPNGKVDRRMLAARPIEQQTSTGVPFVAPQNDLEQQIAQVWQEVLQIPSIGVDDNFFDLGGSSLSMIKVQDKLQPLCSSDVSIITLFQHPTIRSLAAYLLQGLEAPAQAAEPLERAQKQKESFHRQRRKVR